MCLLLLSASAHAGTYTARLRWQPIADPGVAGYRVYTRLANGSYGAGQDVGKPAPGGDGAIAVQVPALNVEGDYAFAVTTYTSTAESPRSNERALGYTQVAPVVDSDADGLTDAQEDTNLNRNVDAGESNPDDADSDNDGVGDAADSCEGTAGGAAVNPQGCACAQIPGCVPCSDNSQCNDGNACNGTETCQAGACMAGQALTCNDGNACTTDSCNPASGCVFSTRSNGSSCSDGNVCNGAETCQAGTCTPGSGLTCNDGNACTTDSCNPTSGCAYTNKANGASCADGNQCNGGETCQSGICQAGAAPSCDDGDACTADSCSAGSGCVHAPIEGCGGGCTTSTECNDNNPCTADACTNGACVNTTRADGTTCNDGLFCTVGETCVAGVCGGGGPNCASQSTACKTATCDEDRNACVTEPLANGTPCGAQDSCTTAPTCQYGICTASTASPCDDQNPCTVDACDGVACTNTPVADGTSCADRNFCDGAETCQAGACVAAAVPECDDGNSCTLDTCDARRRRCSHWATSACCSSDEHCKDDDLCTTNERCSSGRCVSDPVVCERGGACDLTTCDPSRGCQITPLLDGSSCEDGNPCTSGETCRDGRCVVPLASAMAAAASGGTQTLVVDRFILKPMGKRGTRLSARGTFASFSSLDPTSHDVKIEVRDVDGYVLYSTTVPGSEFVADRGGTRYLYWLPNGSAPVHNGLQKLLLVMNGDAVDIVAKGMIPPEEQPEPVVATPAIDDAQLAWAVYAFDGCVSDPNLDCKKWRRFLRRCW
jgi:hypothetical protein